MNPRRKKRLLITSSLVVGVSLAVGLVLFALQQNILDQHPATLRGANPTFDEGLVFARYLDEAAEGFFRIMLGRRSTEIVAKAFSRPDHGLSHQYATFAERDGDIVGMVSGYTAEQHRRSSHEPLKQAAGRWNFRRRIILVLFAPLIRIIDSIADDDFYLQAVAVDNKFRGEGLGSILVDSLEKQARASGATRLALDVSAKNEGARRFYDRRGFVVESQWPKRLRVRALKFYRMTKVIT